MLALLAGIVGGALGALIGGACFPFTPEEAGLRLGVEMFGAVVGATVALLVVALV